jgi:diketogulonate reductase-like aldo/keto reductase
MASQSQFLSIGGVQVPRFLYGTAWKEDATRALTELAIQEGFRGIDTANQRRHYFEAAVGEAIVASIESGQVTRQDLFVQTKFTFRPGQDHRLPYDPSAPIADQVHQSFASSLEHLQTDFVDSYVLHGPTNRTGLSDDDGSAWRAMEEIHGRGGTRLLGISNVSLAQLQLLCEHAEVRPRFVQNRCYANTGWDQGVRRFCVANDIVYQGFSLLTANRELLSHREMARIAQRYARTIPQVIFRFALDVGMVPLTGTSSAQHMRDDLEVFDFRLDANDVERVEYLVAK